MEESDLGTKKCVAELQDTEHKYLDELKFLSELYIPYVRAVSTEEELEQMLLTKVKDIILVSEYMCAQMESRIASWSDEDSIIGDLFLMNADFVDFYGYFTTNIDSAIRKYDDKFEAPEFAAVVTTRQGIDHPPLKYLVTLPIERLRRYKEFVDVFLEKTVSTGFGFCHPDFSNLMDSKRKLEEMIPTNLPAIVTRRQNEEFARVEAMLGSLAQEFMAYLKVLDEEPTTVKAWKKRGLKKHSFSKNRNDSLKSSSSSSSEKFEIGGRNYDAVEIAPDILNAVRKQEETDILSGMVSPKTKSGGASPAFEHYVANCNKVKVRWENEVHTYTLLLFKQCLVFSKIRNKSMKISRIIKLKHLWISEYREKPGFGVVPDREENACLASWLGNELDDELLHRVAISFPSQGAKVYWFNLLTKYIAVIRRKIASQKGVLKVYFKSADSKLRSPVDCLWEGMSCQEVQVTNSQTVEGVVEEAVRTCNMVARHYSLALLVLEDKKIVYEEILVWMEMPLLLQTDIKALLSDPRNMHVIFMLQESSSGRGSPVPANRLNNLKSLLRGRASTTTPYKTLTATSHQPAAYSPGNKPAGIMFGVSLSEFMSPDPETLPTPLLDLLSYIFNSCYNCEGIFRIPGSIQVQRAFEARLENRERIDWGDEDRQDKFFLPNVASSLFKYYLRSIPGGLVPSTLFPVFEEWRTGEAGSAVARMKEILTRIPHANSTVLSYTIHTLCRISSFSAVNLMEAKVLSTCIGPSIVTWPEDTNALSILADSYRRQTPCAVVEFLITHVQAVLGEAPPGLEARRVDEDVKSRRSCIEEKEVDSSEEDRGSVWDLMRSSIKEMDLAAAQMLDATKDFPSPDKTDTSDSSYIGTLV